MFDAHPHPLVRMLAVGKSFGGVSVLRNVSVELREGTVLALVGENGAGKSTLMNILAGSYTEYDGQILVEGQRVQFHSPNAARALGVRIIHQELSLVPSMSIAENIFLGREVRGRVGMLAGRRMRREARELLEPLQIEVDVGRPVEDYSVGVGQAVEIAKALSGQVRVLIMDEPTSALSEAEALRLFEIIARLKARKVAIVYVTHRMEEIYRLADQIAVLRDGNMIGTATPAELSQDKLVQWMVGREVTQTFPQRRSSPRQTVMEVSGLSVDDPGRPGKYLVEGANVSLRSGEIVGLAGLRGAGNSEMLWSLFGAYGAPRGGEVTISGEAYRPTSPRHAMKRGLALVTSDRKATGLVLGMDVVDNATLASLESLPGRGVFLTKPGQRRRAGPVLAEMKTRARAGQEVGTLSGGNQQKVVLAKWLLTRPRILLLDEPTRGIDVVTKHAIYMLLDRLAQEGVAILLVMSELSELLAMSDRVLVMRRGRIAARFAHDEATAEKITAAAM